MKRKISKTLGRRRGWGGFGPGFEEDLRGLINRHGIEKMVSMPDFLLADMICSMILAMGPAIKKTLDWHGCASVCHPSPNSNKFVTCVAPVTGHSALRYRVGGVGPEPVCQKEASKPRLSGVRFLEGIQKIKRGGKK